MFISKLEKQSLIASIKSLETQVANLTQKVNKLEGWKVVKVKDKPLYKWQPEFPVAKKRGRPVGSKNKPK